MRGILLFLVGCGGDPFQGVGDDARDGADLAESAPLAHLADALGGGGTVEDLLRDDAPAWEAAPDADAYFRAANEAAVGLPALTGATRDLKVLSFNTGLLSRRYAVVSKVAVPHIDERREQMGDALFSAGYDVLLLQEVWEIDDARALTEAGEAAGYVVWGGEGRGFHKETGLVIAVRGDLIGGGEVREQGQFQAQWGLENFPGPNLKRGWLRWSFTLAGTERAVHLFDTHTTPFVDEWQTRNLQARELGLLVSAAAGDDLAIVGGDLNAGWYYADDVWIDGTGAEIPGWWANTASVPLLLHYGGLEDAKNATVPNEDVVLGQQVPLAGGAPALDEPFGDASFCDAFPATTFTATDCNSLYFTSYAGTEFPARLDHLAFRDESGGTRAMDSALAFVEPRDFGAAGEFELSDHYGLEVTFQVAEVKP